jgi:transcription elongation factor Elf1
MLRFIRKSTSIHGLLLDDQGQLLDLRHPPPVPQLTRKRVDKLKRSFERKHPGQTPTHDQRMKKPDQAGDTNWSAILSSILSTAGLGLAAVAFSTLGSGVYASVAIVVGVILLLTVLHYFYRVRNEKLRIKLASQGKRPLADEKLIRESLDIFLRCPVCDSSLLPEQANQSDNVLCEECGGAWSFDWFDDGGPYQPPADRMIERPFASFKSQPVAVKDGRGVLVPLRAGQTRGKILAEVRAMEDLLNQHEEALIRRFIVAGLFIMAGGYGIVFFMNLGSLIGSVTMMFIVLLIGYAIMLRLVLDWRLRSAKNILASSLVSQGTCPCCSHQLRTTTSPTDGCLLCDNCGSAWKQESQQT